MSNEPATDTAQWRALQRKLGAFIAEGEASILPTKRFQSMTVPPEATSVPGADGAGTAGRTV